MDVLQQYNLTRFMAFIPQIRKNIAEWRIIEVSLTGKTHHNTAYIAKQLKEYFQDMEGVIFICNSKEILVLARMNVNTNSNSLSNGIHEKMPKYSCVAQGGNVTADGLLKIQIRLQESGQEESTDPQESPLYKTRKSRMQKVVMVVDDDMFMRSLIGKTFKSYNRIIELEDSEQAVEIYLEELPDMVFMDVHLPAGSGIQTLEEILNFDETAHVVMLSSDTVKDNIINSKKIGAKGFIAKPFTQEKLLSCYNQCPTITK